jgi:hypothetical protein
MQTLAPPQRFRRGVARGVIRRRLLVNAVVDPHEAATRLPLGLRPHATELGTVVGCCMLEIDQVRPAGMPAAAGIRLRAAAHRFSVEWDGPSGEPVVGVYVPVRLTDSRLAAMLGGRAFPGVHRPARIDIVDTADGFTWRVEDAAGEFGIRVAVSVPAADPTTACDPVGRTCLCAAVGLSPDHRGRLEAVRMEPDHQLARLVEITDLHSEFIAGFSTAQRAPSFLMQDIAVTWTPERAPRTR